MAFTVLQSLRCSEDRIAYGHSSWLIIIDWYVRKLLYTSAQFYRNLRRWIAMEFVCSWFTMEFLHSWLTMEFPCSRLTMEFLHSWLTMQSLWS